MGKYQRIKDLREDLDLTQENIAKDLKMYKTQYQRYENAEKNSFFEAMITLANYHNVSLDYIAGRTNDKRGLTRSELSEVDTLLLSKFHSLSESGKGKLLERLDVILESEEQQAINKGTA